MNRTFILVTCFLSYSLAAQELLAQDSAVQNLSSQGMDAKDADSSEVDAFSFYADEDFRPWSTIVETEFNGDLEFSIGHVNDDSFRFGQYNGLSEEGGNVQFSGSYANWDTNSSLFDYWKVAGYDLGLSTGSAQLEFGAVRDYKFNFAYQQLEQIKNDTGATPYTRSNDTLILADNWLSGQNTTEMTEFYNTASRFEQSLKRSGLNLTYVKELDPNWSFNSSYRLEEKNGTKTQGAAFYANANNGHSVILPSNVDYKTQTLDLGFAYHEIQYNLIGSYVFSRFENQQKSLTWQNPYSSSLGSGTSYPDAYGQLALEPDNDFHQFRLMGNYIFDNSLRFSGDMSFAQTSQNDSFLPYSANTEVAAGLLPSQSLNGEITTFTAKAKLYYRYNRDVVIQAFSRYEDKDNGSARMAFQSVFGDAWAPQEDKYKVYNRPYSRNVFHNKIEGSYRLTSLHKLSLSYAHEEINRYNHAVDTTKENSIELKLRSRPLTDLSTRFELNYKDRTASVYNWEQSYFSLFDTQLINETPDNQRFTNHPLLSQYYLSNRQQTLAKFNAGYVFSQQWQANADIFYQKNDYQQSELGLTGDEMSHLTLSTMWLYSSRLNMSVYFSYDDYKFEQTGRAFRGGIEKNAFEIYPPLPQASDPSRNWQLSPNDVSQSLGYTGNWTVLPKKLDMDWDYRFTDSSSSNDDLQSGGAADLDNMAFPDVINKEHHLSLNTSFHASEDLSFKFNYQYYRFKGQNWAFDQVTATSIDKVLGTGEYSANDQIHVFNISLIYRLK